MLRSIAAAGILAAAVLTLAGPVRAEPPRLGLPADCEPGRTCWISKLVDRDPGERTVDYRCGARTVGNHDGVDIAVADMATAAETRVLAAAPGRVLGVRDGMDDVNILSIDPKSIAGRECGNGVVIDHGDGWQTQYCHLRRGSLTVAQGQTVERGQELGRIGLSGSTELPHVHLTVRHAGKPVDPFTGSGLDGTCGDTAAPLWEPAVANALPYEARRLAIVGAAPGAADKVAARAGDYGDTLAPDAGAFVVWADVLAPRRGDRLRFRIRDAEGRWIFDNTQTIEKDFAQWFGFSGLRRKVPAWPAGDYRLEVTLEPAGGGDALVATRQVTVPSR